MKFILFSKLAYKCIYFHYFYPENRMCRGRQIHWWLTVMWTVSCVYSRVVDIISEEKPFFVIVVNDFITAALCEYGRDVFTALLSTSWDNLASFAPMLFWFHVGFNWKHLNVYSSFYTEMFKYTAPPFHPPHRPSLALSAKHSPEFKTIRCLYSWSYS